MDVPFPDQVLKIKNLTQKSVPSTKIHQNKLIIKCTDQKRQNDTDTSYNFRKRTAVDEYNKNLPFTKDIQSKAVSFKHMNKLVNFYMVFKNSCQQHSSFRLANQLPRDIDFKQLAQQSANTGHRLHTVLRKTAVHVIIFRANIYEIQASFTNILIIRNTFNSSSKKQNVKRYE